MLSFTDLAVTAAEADAYVAARAYTGWTGDATAKDAALRRGQDYIAGVYNLRWCSTFENDAAPDEVKYAIIEAALLEAATPGFFTKTYTPGERKVLTEVRGIKWEVIGGGNASTAYPVSTRIEGILSSLLCAPMPAILVV